MPSPTRSVRCWQPVSPTSFERKWQLVGAAIAIGLFGVLFAQQTVVPLLILFGVLITLSNNVMSYSFHAYQTELFPTRIRARAVGFTYSFSRISTVFASFIIGFFLQKGGVTGVFGADRLCHADGGAVDRSAGPTDTGSATRANLALIVSGLHRPAHSTRNGNKASSRRRPCSVAVRRPSCQVT